LRCLWQYSWVPPPLSSSTGRIESTLAKFTTRSASTLGTCWACWCSMCRCSTWCAQSVGRRRPSALRCTSRRSTIPPSIVRYRSCTSPDLNIIIHHTIHTISCNTIRKIPKMIPGLALCRPACVSIMECQWPLRTRIKRAGRARVLPQIIQISFNRYPLTSSCVLPLLILPQSSSNTWTAMSTRKTTSSTSSSSLKTSSAGKSAAQTSSLRRWPLQVHLIWRRGCSRLTNILGPPQATKCHSIRVRDH